jgi:hypothetical protein
MMTAQDIEAGAATGNPQRLTRWRAAPRAGRAPMAKRIALPVLFAAGLLQAPAQAQYYGDCAPLLSRQDSDVGREVYALLRRENDQLQPGAISLCYSDDDQPPIDVQLGASYALIYVNRDLFRRVFGPGAGQGQRPPIAHTYLLAKSVIQASMVAEGTDPSYDQRTLIVAGSYPLIGRRLADLGYSPEELNGLLDRIVDFDRSEEARSAAESIRRHYGDRYLTMHPSPAAEAARNELASSPSPPAPAAPDRSQAPASPLARLWEWIAGSLERIGTIGTGIAMLIAAGAWAVRRASRRRRPANPDRP